MLNSGRARIFLKCPMANIKLKRRAGIESAIAAETVSIDPVMRANVLNSMMLFDNLERMTHMKAHIAIKSIRPPFDVHRMRAIPIGHRSGSALFLTHDFFSA